MRHGDDHRDQYIPSWSLNDLMQIEPSSEGRTTRLRPRLLHHVDVSARRLCILLAALTFSAATAQAPQPSWWDRAQAIYQKAVDQGRPLAEKFARQFPKRFETLKQNTLRSIKHGQKILDDADLEQKKNFALELWRIRQSLDLATLFSAPVLKELTGLDVPTLAALKSRVVKMEKSLEAQIDQLSKR